MDNSVPQKRCAKCGEFFPATREFFCLNSQAKDKLFTYCKPCLKEQNARYKREHKEEISNQTHARREILKSQGLPTRDQVWRQKNPERVRELGRRQYAADPERRRAATRKYRQTEQGKISDRAYSRTRKMQKKGLPGKYTRQDVERQHKAQNGKCYWCAKKFDKGKNAYHVDHLIPITREGSSNDPWNLVLACPKCNQARKNKLPHEWPQGNRLL